VRESCLRGWATNPGWAGRCAGRDAVVLGQGMDCADGRTEQCAIVYNFCILLIFNKYFHIKRSF
ncbi:MAG: hypothetical protein COS43_06230, partial [Gallionellales bacterium CG03_land_8_20_14_0_80_55_15]